MVSSFSSTETWVQAIFRNLKGAFTKMPGIAFFLFKMDQIYFTFSVLWFQYISWWMWFENNKHRFHKLMSPVINSNFPTLLNSRSCYLALSRSPLSFWTCPEGRKMWNRKIKPRRRWEVRRTWVDYFCIKIQSSRALFMCTHFFFPPSHVSVAVEEDF